VYIQELKAQKVSQSLSHLAGSSSDLQAFSQGLATLLDKVGIFPFYILTCWRYDSVCAAAFTL
jgi:hypothetical protein